MSWVDQSLKVKVLASQSCLTLCKPMGCSLLGSSVHGILQARILGWVAIPFSRGSSRPRDQSLVSCIGSQVLHCLSHQGSPGKTWPIFQFSSVAQSCPTLCHSMDCSMQGFPVHHQLPEFTQTYVHRVGHAFQPSHPLSSPSSPALNLSRIRVFSNESALRIRWSKKCSFSFNISPSNEHSGLICFRMDWLDLLAVQGTVKSLLQNHSSEASNLWHSALFIVQLCHPYMENHSFD